MLTCNNTNAIRFKRWVYWRVCTLRIIEFRVCFINGGLSLIDDLHVSSYIISTPSHRYYYEKDENLDAKAVVFYTATLLAAVMALNELLESLAGVR